MTSLEYYIEQVEQFISAFIDDIESGEGTVVTQTKLAVYQEVLEHLEEIEQEPSGDLISREETLTAFADYVGSGMSMNDYDALWNIVTKMPSVTPTQRWIPVSERLPEKNMPCLVAVGKFNLTQMAMYSDLMGTINHRIFYQGDVGYGSFEDITEYVKAWMPLPKPYEPQESEDKE